MSSLRDAEMPGIPNGTQPVLGLGTFGHAVLTGATSSSQAVSRTVKITLSRPGPLTLALLEAIKDSQKSLKQIAREAKVDYTSLCRFVTRERDLNVVNVGRLGEYFKLSIAPSPSGRRALEMLEMFEFLGCQSGGVVRINDFAKHLVRTALEWDSSTTQGAIAKWTGIPAASLSALLRVRRYNLGLSSLDKLLICYSIIVDTWATKGLPACRKAF